MSEPTVVTRFAPSPTGSLHVGGARTALFAWAYARRHGHAGKFILRIEDTDQTRSSAASESSILRDLKWFGLDWDEGPDVGGPAGPYRQSERLPIYHEQIARLREMGLAYEKDGAIRFHCPADVAFDDAVYGHIEVKAADIEDFVIQKSDGFPTFHMAVTVDDALMKITHVIRGQEHLSNTPKHVALQRALGYAMPAYVHLPTIMNPDGSKMSKRDKAKAARTAAKAQGMKSLDDPAIDPQRFAAFMDKKSDESAVAHAIAAKLGLTLPEIEVADFQFSGYLPQALSNYLSLLGWNPGQDVERFDNAFLIERFNFDRINKSNSCFDRQKLFRFNGERLASLPPEQFRDLWQAHCQAHHPAFDVGLGHMAAETFAQLAAIYQPRARTLSEPCQMAAFFVLADDQIAYDAKAVAKVLQANDAAGWGILRDLTGILPQVDPWRAETIHAALEQAAVRMERKIADLAQPLRVAATGNTVSPPIDQTLAILGKERTLNRIRRCVDKVRTPSVS
ncbi:MAG: glutamate--tRNA ligase [Phycisphaeraceae bacterium]|nr:glutamate--tRNA ligase [Phycisphaeraceae bacterium]